MGMVIDGKFSPDLMDLKRAAGQLESAAYPSWLEGGHSVRERVSFHGQVPMRPVCNRASASDVCDLPSQQFDLVKSVVYEGFENYVEMFDVWKHGDVIVRKIYTGSRHRDKYGMWHG